MRGDSSGKSMEFYLNNMTIASLKRVLEDSKENKVKGLLRTQKKVFVYFSKFSIFNKNVLSTKICIYLLVFIIYLCILYVLYICMWTFICMDTCLDWWGMHECLDLLMLPTIEKVACKRSIRCLGSLVSGNNFHHFAS